MEHVINELKEIIPTIHHDKIFIVGGLVRDHLRGTLKGTLDVDLVAKLPVADILALGATPVEAKSAAPVFLLNHSVFGDIQIAQPRTERKIGYGYHGFEFHGDHTLPIETDLARRDFTVNAMAMTLNGEVIDPFQGRKHLEKSELHHVSDFFREDPVRVFRAYRFCARGYHLAERTRTYIRSMDLTQEFAELPAERVFLEMEKALKSPSPHRFFEEMVTTGKGEEFFPEVFRMSAIPAGPAEHHPEGDLLAHSLLVLRKVAERTEDPVARCAAFFHDLGKMLTPAEEYPRHLGHDERGEELACQVLHRLRSPGVYARATALANRLHMKGARFAEMKDSSKIRFAKEAAPIKDILPLIIQADAGVTLEGFERCIEIALMSATKLGISVEKLKTMAPADIHSTVIQKQVELLRK